MRTLIVVDQAGNHGPQAGGLIWQAVALPAAPRPGHVTFNVGGFGTDELLITALNLTAP